MTALVSESKAVAAPSCDEDKPKEKLIDHRDIGMEQDLFFFNEVSPGSCFFLPKGTIIYNKLMNMLRKEYTKRGFQEVMTPTICKKALWETSEHWAKYKENMFVLEADDDKD